MWGLRNSLTVMAVAGSIYGLGTAHVAVAQDADCANAGYAASLPKPPDGCHPEVVTAAGNERPTQNWARTSGLEHWRDQVINKYGERFAVWRKAACRKRECVPGAITGMTRCTFSAYPCSVKPEPVSLPEQEPDTDTDDTLTKSEILEMQRLLRKSGYQLKIDGIFGPKTERALSKWQRIRKFDDDGLPTLKNLELLRKYA